MKDFKEVEKHVLGRLKRELPDKLSYHGAHHTQDVLHSAITIARDEKISDYDMLLLKVAVLYHDLGFTRVYKDHEEVGVEIARKELPGLGFNKEEIDIIAGMIMATKIPQSPKTQLEKIIADADLEYLGRDDFETIGRTLFEEMKVYLDVESERQWNIIQMNFLRSHHYFTNFCKRNREAKKNQYLDQIIKIVETYT